MNDLAIKNVSHSFGSHLAVDEVNLSIAPGELVCLVGPSGCGKTTLLRVAAGLEDLQDGSVRIGGDVMADGRLSVPPEQRNVGLVFQDYALFPHLTVRGNIAFGLQELSGPQRDERVVQALERTGMVEYSGAYPHELSGGQQQRVAIARALANNPTILLADEPTGNLDTVRGREVMQLLTDLNKTQGITIILVTHEAEMATYAHRVIHFRDGMIESDQKNGAAS